MLANKGITAIAFETIKIETVSTRYSHGDVREFRPSTHRAHSAGYHGGVGGGGGAARAIRRQPLQTASNRTTFRRTGKGLLLTQGRYASNEGDGQVCAVCRSAWLIGNRT